MGRGALFCMSEVFVVVFWCVDWDVCLSELVLLYISWHLRTMHFVLFWPVPK